MTIQDKILHEKPGMTPERAALYNRMKPKNLVPLWEVMHGLVTPEPKSRCRPAHWRYDEVRPFITEAGHVITALEAERRVLVLENPGMPGESLITTALYAGLQLILPGELAPSHRHTQSALRFVIEGNGAFTAVNGEKTIMHEGDFVITPSWTFHDHGNESDQPMVWLDGLDVPLAQTMDVSFMERPGATTQAPAKPLGDNLARYGQGLLPVDYEPTRPTSPIFNYPYARTREALDTMSRTEAWDPCHGLKVQYANPASGDFAMPTMGAFMQLLPKGFESAPYRSTDATVYTPVEGKGRTTIQHHTGTVTYAWSKRDVFVIPSWAKHWHEVDSETVLFSFSDRPAQKKLGLWRQDRGNS